MNRIIFISISLITALIPLFSWSQSYSYVPFPDSGAIWSEIYGFPIYDPRGAVYERFAVNGEDTVIQDKTYTKLFMFYDTVFNKSNATCIGGIREDIDKKIYFIGDTILHDLKPAPIFQKGEDLLLYDFSLNVGDTMMEGNFLGERIVQAIDTILIGATYRKRLHFNTWVKWIEGIGSIMGLLFSGDLPTDGTNNVLICFKQNDTILYFDERYSECIPLITGVLPVNDGLHVTTVFPNPVSGDVLHFKFSEELNIKIEIFDSLGNIIDCFYTMQQPELDYSIANFRKGFYSYIAIKSNGTVESGKFVVQ